MVTLIIYVYILIRLRCQVFQCEDLVLSTVISHSGGSCCEVEWKIRWHRESNPGDWSNSPHGFRPWAVTTVPCHRSIKLSVHRIYIQLQSGFPLLLRPRYLFISIYRAVFLYYLFSWKIDSCVLCVHCFIAYWVLTFALLLLFASLSALLRIDHTYSCRS